MALSALMTADHQFIDTECSTVAARRPASRPGVRFDSFPDYRNVFEDIRSEGDRVVADGLGVGSSARIPALPVMTVVPVV